MSLPLRFILFVIALIVIYYGFGTYLPYTALYSDKNAEDGYWYTYFYYVPAEPWKKKLGFTLWKSDYFVLYPNSENEIRFYEFRQMHSTILSRILAPPAFVLDLVMFIVTKGKFFGLGFGFVSVLYLISTVLDASLIMMLDFKRLKSYQYIVANDAESVVTGARRKPPALWKINTLLDVFFYFGQAPIRFSKTQNYLIYRLKNGKLLYVFLKDSFETMPEEDLSPYDHYGPDFPITHYNPAMTVWVDECICVDSTNLSTLSGKDILPQDMPDVLLPNHS